MLSFLHFFLTKKTIQSFATMKRDSKKREFKNLKKLLWREQNLNSKQKVSRVEGKASRGKEKEGGRD